MEIYIVIVINPMRRFVVGPRIACSALGFPRTKLLKTTICGLTLCSLITYLWIFLGEDQGQELLRKQEIRDQIEKLVRAASYEVHLDDIKELGNDIYRVKQKMESEKQQCPLVSQYNSSSPNFHCVHFNDTNEFPTKEIRTLWFNNHCPANIDVDIRTGNIQKTSFSKCTLYRFSQSELEFISKKLEKNEFRSAWARSVFDVIEEKEIWLCLPNIFFFSQPKTGTTSLFSDISSHPSVVHIDEDLKEPSFFTDPGVKLGIQSSDFIFYLRTQCPIDQMITEEMKVNAVKEAAFTGTVPTICTPMQCGDYSTHYAHIFPFQVMKSVKKTLPDVSVVSLMREPISRMKSETNMYLHSAEELNNMLPDSILFIHKVACSFADRQYQISPLCKTKQDDLGNEMFPFLHINAIRTLLKRDKIIERVIMHDMFGFGKGFYWILVEFLLEVFSSQQCLFLFADDIFSESKDQRNQSLQQLWLFLGIETLHYPPKTHKNQQVPLDGIDKTIIEILSRISHVHNEELSKILQVPLPPNWL